MMLFLVPRKEGVGVGGRKGGRETDRQGGTDRQTRGRGSIPLTVRQSHTKGV